jgi:hypothetical protein
MSVLVFLLCTASHLPTSPQHEIQNTTAWKPRPPRTEQALIVTEADALEPLLVPLLRRDLARSGPRTVITIGACASS